MRCISVHNAVVYSMTHTVLKKMYKSALMTIKQRKVGEDHGTFATLLNRLDVSNHRGELYIWLVGCNSTQK